MKGNVKWFNPAKGYGFIVDEKGNDVFVHYTKINMEGYKTLNPGDEVTFDLQPDEKTGKDAAANVVITKHAPAAN